MYLQEIHFSCAWSENFARWWYPPMITLPAGPGLPCDHGNSRQNKAHRPLHLHSATGLAGWLLFPHHQRPGHLAVTPNSTTSVWLVFTPCKCFSPACYARCEITIFYCQLPSQSYVSRRVGGKRRRRQAGGPLLLIRARNVRFVMNQRTRRGACPHATVATTLNF